MKKELPYTSTIKTRPYFYMETRKIASYIIEGFSEEEIEAKVVEENELQFQTNRRRREVYRTIMNRLKILDDFLLEQIAKGDTETSKLLVLYSILKTDRLFYEFMRDVFRDAVQLYNQPLTNRDFVNFFEAKRQQSERVASWKNYTFYKLQQIYLRILYESGLLKSQKEPRLPQVGILNYDVKQHLLALRDERYVEILTGDLR